MSTTYDATAPVASVLISTFRRAPALPALCALLEQQDAPRETFEVVIADNASPDETWEQLKQWIAVTPLAARAERVTENTGPSSGRNAALAAARGEFVVFTDDDCQPEAAWLRHMLDALQDGAVVVQGRTEPPPGDAPSTWDRVIDIRGVTQLFEMCNLGFRRADVVAAGGFRALARYRGGRDGLPFGGEDTLLGWSVVRATGGEVRFVPGARVRHPVERQTFRAWLRARRRVAVFPALLAEVPELRPRFFLRWFFARRSAAFDLLVMGLVVALGLRSWIPMLAGVPYVVEAAPRRGKRRGSAEKTAGRVVGDAVTCWHLARGSWQARRVLL